MRKLYTLLTAIIITTSAFAQAPEKMSYQAVVRNGSNALVTSSLVGMQISILQGSSSGTAVYVETQTPTSNANGLVSIEIGGGTLVSGDFSTIDWANGPYFVKTETDPTGGTSYTITGTSQLLSVPYALHAKNTDSWTSIIDTTYTMKNVGIGVESATTPLTVVNNSPEDPVLIMNASSDMHHTLRHSGFSVVDSTNNFSVFASMHTTSSLLQVNGEPTFTFFTPTAQGANRHYNFRINGGNRLSISGTGTTHINDVLSLEPRSTAPTAPNEGDVYMDSITHKLMVYDGTTWQACW